jgi:hypothetical protein
MRCGLTTSGYASTCIPVVFYGASHQQQQLTANDYHSSHIVSSECGVVQHDQVLLSGHYQAVRQSHLDHPMD